MAITAQKFLPSSTKATQGGALVKASQKVVGGKSSRLIEDIGIIKVTTIEVDNILKGTLALKKKQLDQQKRLESSKRREKQEEKLETKPQAEKGTAIKVPTLPKMGFLERIKNFIGNIILGYFAVRMIDYLPKLIPIVKFLGTATDFVIDSGGKLLDGLVTFVDWGYKAYDATRGFLKNLGGDNFVKVFDAFNGAVGTLIETAVIATTVIASQGRGGVLDVGLDMLTDVGTQRGAQAAAQAGAQAGGTAARAGGLGAGAVAGIVAGAGLLASALGEGAFQFRKIAEKPIQDAQSAYDKEKNPFMKIGRGAFLAGMNMLLGPIKGIGLMLDIIGAPFRYAIELLRYPFLSEEDKKKQAFNLAKLDARIREDFRKGLNILTLGFAFKEKGSFGNIYGNKGAQKEMMGKMQGGGITRGGKRQGGIKRTLRKGKYKRKIRPTPKKPGKIEITSPGADVGGEEKLFGIFPKPKLPDVVNPFKVIKNTGDELGKTDYFGPILAISSKITAGQLPTQQDYQNAGIGINLLIAEGIRQKQLKGGLIAAFAEGGLVDPDVLSAVETGGDVSNWVAKTFKGEIESNAQKTLRMIRENAGKKKPEEQQAPSPGDMGEGFGVQVSSDSPDFWLLATAALFENSDPQGAADAAQAIYNRVAMPGDPWNVDNSIRKAILNPGQFQPVSDYGGAAVWNKIKTKEDALRFIKTYGKTQAQLETVAAALLDKNRQQNARQFVGPRDSFRTYDFENKKNHLADETEVRRLGHAFGFEPRGATIGMFKSGKLSAAVVNESIKGDVKPTGSNGRLESSKLTTVQGSYQLRNDAAQAFMSAAASARKSGINLQLSSAYRSYEKQAELYANRASNPYPVAAPGTSNHGYGLAIDIPEGTPGHTWMMRNGRTFGWKNLPGDAVHFDFVGGISRASKFHGENFGIVPKGGMKLTLHEGEMYKVIDKDSVNLLGFDLTKEIIDIENKSQLVAKAPSIIERLKAISGYTDYEQAQPEVVYVPVPMPVPIAQSQNTISSSGLTLIGSGNNSFEHLYKGT